MYSNSLVLIQKAKLDEKKGTKFYFIFVSISYFISIRLLKENYVPRSRKLDERCEQRKIPRIGICEIFDLIKRDFESKNV